MLNYKWGFLPWISHIIIIIVVVDGGYLYEVLCNLNLKIKLLLAVVVENQVGGASLVKQSQGIRNNRKIVLKDRNYSKNSFTVRIRFELKLRHLRGQNKQWEVSTEPCDIKGHEKIICGDFYVDRKPSWIVWFMHLKLMDQRTREEKLVSLQNISSLGPAAAVFSVFSAFLDRFSAAGPCKDVKKMLGHYW